MGGRRYVGRFAPSPTGPLHAGSLVAALGSWLDARAHGGDWLLRIEDLDAPRNVAGADATILAQLEALGLRADAPAAWQSRRAAGHAAALARLLDAGRAYRCDCTRREVDAAQAAAGRPHVAGAERVYGGRCRPERCGARGRAAWAVRFRLPDDAAQRVVRWTDRRLGAQQQDVAQAVGDFVLRRADGITAYQLAVVVDDAAQGVSHVVRGADLVDNTERQILLQRALGLPTPAYLHTPLVCAADGRKLSKQNGAAAVDVADPLRSLQAAGARLGLPALPATTRDDWLAQAVRAWPWREVASSTVPPPDRHPP